MKLKHTRDYREARRPEYPSLEEQVGAIMKWMTTQPLPPDVKAVVDQVEAVKRKFPKQSTNSK